MVAEAQLALEKQAVEPATKGTKQKTPQTRRGDKQKAPPSKKAKQEAEELKRFEAFYAQKKAQEKAEETLRKNALEKRKVPKVGGKGGKGGEVGQAAKPADNPKAKAPTAVQQEQIMAQEKK